MSDKGNEGMRDEGTDGQRETNSPSLVPAVAPSRRLSFPLSPFVWCILLLIVAILLSAAIGAELKGAFAQISSEELVKQNPNIIVLGDALYGVTADTVAQRPGWNALSAVKDKKVFAFDDNLISRPGPRLIEGLVAMAELVHPELFR